MEHLGIELPHQDLAGLISHVGDLGTEVSHASADLAATATVDHPETALSIHQVQALQAGGDKALLTSASPLAISTVANGISSYSRTGTGEDAGGTWNYGWRHVVEPGSLQDGVKVRATFEARSDQNMTLDGAVFAPKAATGDAYDYDGANAVKLTFNGQTSAVVNAGTRLTSDWVTMSVDDAKAYVLAYGTENGYKGSWGEGNSFVKGNDPTGFGTANTSGYTQENMFGGLVKIEVQQASTTTPTSPTPTTPTTDPAATKIVVNASGSAAGGTNAHFKLLVDGVKVGEGTTTTTAKDYAFTAKVTPDQAHKVQVQFDNDAYINGQDRNLFVNKITINDHAVAPTDAIVTYDKGALDGKDVVKGQTGMWWNGTLVVAADKAWFPSSTTTTPTTPTTPTSPTPTTPTSPTPTSPTPTTPVGDTTLYPSSTPASQIFYVDATNGSDSNTGHDASHAWKSLSKVNATAFSAGSVILFERGETWHDSLVVSSSGTSDKAIIYGAYGTGNDPVIDANDGLFYAASLNNKDNIVFDNLTISGSSDVGLFLSGSPENVKVTNSTVSGNYGSGIVVGGTSNNLLIDHSKVDNNGAYGIVHYNADNTNQYITNNEISRNGWRSDGMYSGWNGLIKSGEIAGNTVHDNGVGGGGGGGRSHGLYHDDGQVGSTLKIHDNVIYGQANGGGIIAKSSTDLYNNTLYGNSVGLSLGQNADNNITYNITGNQIFNNLNGGIIEHTKGTGSITLNMSGNTFWANNGYAAYSFADSFTKNISNNTVYTTTRANPTA